ncbi:hypothetical protein NCS52_01423700 [Fusarium sp. LHS14.1]|nr:hypothetical protein NCS52_01423700 [Fusarium sp. LHS14.1]
MADACLVELARKANLFEETGMVPVMDYSAYVIKSDTLLTQTLKDELKAAVETLENLQRLRKDWQPDTDGKVLNVVDPSIWPLVYGTSKILPDQHVPLEGCTDYCGMGDEIPQPPKPMLDRRRAMLLPLRMKAFGTRFQWLPCNIYLTDEKPRISIYVNNLHPVRDAPLYSIIERLIEKSLPAWDIVFRSTDEAFQVSRFEPIKAIKYRCSAPETSHVRGKGFFKRGVQTTSPGAMVGRDVTQIQVIVKMANIHLAPEKPNYEGSPWQIEGQAIERICAKALFCYDRDNIADTPINFRTQGNREKLGTKLDCIYDDWPSIERVFAMEVHGTRLQDIGSVLTREGRAIFYANVYQNRLGPFELTDKTSPGHCKMLALFLVDPMNPISSTANIPPQ